MNSWTGAGYDSELPTVPLKLFKSVFDNVDNVLLEHGGLPHATYLALHQLSR